MKTAVIITGLVKSDRGVYGLKRNNEIIRGKFPDAAFFYGTWESQGSAFGAAFPEYVPVLMEEPVLEYHPYQIHEKDFVSEDYVEACRFCLKKKRREWSSHHTKQILSHSEMVSRAGSGSDVIVRARFDTHIHKTASFEEYAHDAVLNKRAHGFAATDRNRFHELRDSDQITGKKCWIWDQLIIHPPQLLDPVAVRNLHERKLLHGAETGWYQVLSLPHGSNHINHQGWVNHDKNVAPEFFY